MEKINLKEMDQKELKALAYDQLRNLEAIKLNLRLIEEELANKQSSEGSEEKPK